MEYQVVFCLFILLTVLPGIHGNTGTYGNVTWCSVNDLEHLKCTEYAEAVRQSRQFPLDLFCKKAPSKDQCMNFLDNNLVDLVELDPGEMFSAGRHHSIIPIASELYGPSEQSGSFSVAVVHELFNISSLQELMGRRVCFSSVGDMAGWVLPMATLIERNILQIHDCNNLVKSAAQFFGPSCAPNSLLDKHNPTGDNPQKMCEICAGRPGDRCSGNDPFANYEGAFKCLQKEGEVAFLKHTTIHEVTEMRPEIKFKYRLLCPDGRLESVDRHETCNWGFVPANVIATTSENSEERKEQIQKFLQKSLELFGKIRYQDMDITTSGYNPFSAYNVNNYSINTQDFKPPWKEASEKRFNLFSRYSNGSNLLIQDTVSRFVPLYGQKQTYSGYLGKHLQTFDKLGKCPVASAGLCVVSDKEFEKCSKMRSAFKAQNLKPDIHCVRAASQLICMHMIHQGSADLTMLEAGDIYRAGSRFGLVPILAEQYNLNEPYYYAVAVAQQRDKDTDLLYLKGKRSCGGSMMSAAGWVIPLAFLITNDRMRSYGCDSARAASEFFSKGCVPGVLNREFAAPYSSEYKSYRNLCDLCHGESRSYCQRDASEPFYGHSGAFRCLVEGGGEIAFVKHTTIFENTAGRNPLFWSRNVMPEDFELLCRDGSRQTHDKYRECNLGKVAANAMVTGKHKKPHEIEAYIALFVYAQQFYGSKYTEPFTFKMFVSPFEHRDLIFQDSTQQIKPVPEERRDYRRYLGTDLLVALRLVDCHVSISATTTHVLSPFLLIISIAMIIAKMKF